MCSAYPLKTLALFQLRKLSSSHAEGVYMRAAGYQEVVLFYFPAQPPLGMHF